MTAPAATPDLTDAWASTDPLGEALHFLRMSGTFYCRSEFTAPWGLDLPAMPQCLMFHVLTVGECWLEAAGDLPRRLAPGDLVLVPHGEGHRLVSSPGESAAGLFELPRAYASDRYEVLRQGGGGEPTAMICGAVRFDHPAALQLVRLLPRVLEAQVREPSQRDWLMSTLQLMESEARAMRPGGETVITRLADILVIQAIRAWIEQDPAAQSGWLGALQDRQLGRALSLIHREPARDWSLPALADAAAMSRSAFAARFAERVGMPPMQYVTRWRMHVALSWLQEREIAVAELAERLGYQSEAAFSRAFKRCIGTSPGSIRRA
ncbi:MULTISPECIES: AraC family transcriptional regulator [Pseudomonas]|uniref:AraC family transcriptional regulator n=1 Tax=Pseudomonas TaxID=286 RepID=UPI0006D45E02|nr:MULTISPECIES: AraC family transcriptional regulator [Pseudomonas]MCE4072806.1 AraC family transcriptional regulator [Pseudomonas nitritireducens]MCE4082015.1 AraC family transcriptional regulator [Pseudomonas nitroreducens]OBY89139.1 cupin [Pseudomonas sp. AU11447]